MKFKLDEDLGRAAATVLLEAGIDVLTISDQQMEGMLDRDVIAVCQREERCLVTLDIEFGNPLLYPPSLYRAIVLLRVPARMTAQLILDTVRTLRDALLTRGLPSGSSIPLPGPDRRLWIVRPGRIRLYQRDEPDDE